MIAEPLPTTAYHPDGLANLLVGFWRQVHLDLMAGRHEAADWLCTPAFADWLQASGSDLPSADARERLLDLYWPRDRWRPTCRRQEED